MHDILPILRMKSEHMRYSLPNEAGEKHLEKRKNEKHMDAIFRKKHDRPNARERREGNWSADNKPKVKKESMNFTEFTDLNIFGLKVKMNDSL